MLCEVLQRYDLHRWKWILLFFEWCWILGASEKYKINTERLIGEDGCFRTKSVFCIERLECACDKSASNSGNVHTWVMIILEIYTFIRKISFKSLVIRGIIIKTPDHEECFQMSRFQSWGGTGSPPKKSMIRPFFWKSDKWTHIQFGGPEWVLMIFRTPREELLGQKIAFMYFGKSEVTLEVYDVNKNHFWRFGSSYEPCKNSSRRTTRPKNSIFCILRYKKAL